MIACGKYSMRGSGSSNTTVSTSSHISRSAGRAARSSDFRNAYAADTSRRFFLYPTFTSGGTGAPSERVFTSITCSTWSFSVITSNSKCPALQFLFRILCPSPVSHEHASASPLSPIICLFVFISPAISQLSPTPPSNQKNQQRYFADSFEKIFFSIL